MVIRRKIAFILLIVFSSSSAQTSSGVELSAEKRMLQAISSSDIKVFRELLNSGGDPTKPTKDQKYISSSVCASTAVGKEEFFDAILQTDWPLDGVFDESVFYGSAISCAISYRNFPVYKALVDAGFDINMVLNPHIADSSLEWRVFDLSLGPLKLNIAWDILQRIEPTEKQVLRLIHTVERPRVVGHPDLPYHEKLLEWLDAHGVEYDQPILMPSKHPKPKQ